MQTIMDDYVIGFIEDREKIVVLVESKSGSEVSQISDQEEYARFTTEHIEKTEPYDNELNAREKIVFEKWDIELHIDNDHHLNIYTPDGTVWDEVIPSKSNNPTITIKAS